MAKIVEAKAFGDTHRDLSRNPDVVYMLRACDVHAHAHAQSQSSRDWPPRQSEARHILDKCKLEERERERERERGGGKVKHEWVSS